jgi:Predicted pyridoxal phosphate-dependent enzyme apparently involved in regulation of cell wall biogenesis
MSSLALFGGAPAVREEQRDLFLWPIITEEDEAAVLSVLHDRSMSGTEITKQFEKEMAQWLGVKYALGYCNGTAGILAALWACGLGAGDEIICPSMTYWASAAPALTLGIGVNFAEIDPVSLCIDPDDIERRIGPRTKAIVVVHYAAHPCDMDRILPIARRHGLKVIEDASHAQGGRYKGRRCGTLGDVSVMSLMTTKSFAIGEGGMLFTDDRTIFERCISFGFYERTGSQSEVFTADDQLTDPALKRYAGLPVGGYKHRMHQMSSAVGRVQLKYYDERIAVIDAAMSYFWDSLAGLPRLSPHRVDGKDGSTMGGWYYPLGLFDQGRLPPGSLAKVCAALRAEGIGVCSPCKNGPLHLHPAFQDLDLFRLGKPTMVSFAERDLRQGPGSLPNAEAIRERAFSVPWFKQLWKPQIDAYVEGFRKVFSNVDEIVERK